jgi:hypothetical protein
MKKIVLSLVVLLSICFPIFGSEPAPLAVPAAAIKEAAPYEPSAAVTSTDTIAKKLALAEPLAVIEGPEKVETGRSAWLKPNMAMSVGKSFSWLVIPESAAQYSMVLPLFGGMDIGDPDDPTDDRPIVHKWMHFDCPVPGTYAFILIATEGDKSHAAVHTIINGEAGPNPPVPPTPPDPPIPPDPDLDIPEPNAEYQTHVVKVAPLLTGKTAKVDGVELAKFYMDLSNVIGRDQEIIKTTADIRAVNIKAGKLMFQKSLKGRYPDLGAEIDSVFQKVLGTKIIDLTAESRQKAVKITQALAWACYQAANK